MRNIFINNYRKNCKRQIVSDNTENQIIINNHSRTVGNIGETNLVMKEIEKILSNKAKIATA